MSYVCEIVNTATQSCELWVQQVSLLDQLSITKDQMVTLGTSIIGVYGVIIAFVLFNNFSKRA